MRLKVFVSGACYQDVILHVESFPAEDSKMRAKSVEKRRGGNGANVLQVLSQFAPTNLSASQLRRKSSASTDPPVVGSSQRGEAALEAGSNVAVFHPSYELETNLVAVLAGADPAEHPDAATQSYIMTDLMENTPLISLRHCVFRGSGYSEPTAWIVSTGATRTIINHTTLPELCAHEFREKLSGSLDQCLQNHLDPSSVWFHFEGRNVPEVEEMIDWLSRMREKEQEKNSGGRRSHWWKAVDGKAVSTAGNCVPSNASSLSPNPNMDVLGTSPGGNSLGKRTSGDAILATLSNHSPTLRSSSLVEESDSVEPRFTISVEFEKPNRPGLDNLLPKADVLFFSKWYAEGRGFQNAPTGFLDNIRRECKQGALLFLTWSEQGCFYLINDLTRPAQTFHVPAPKIFPVDTIGAGDTFAAGVLYTLGLLGWDVRRSIDFSVRLATAKCAQVGFDGLAERVF